MKTARLKQHTSQHPFFRLSTLMMLMLTMLFASVALASGYDDDDDGDKLRPPTELGPHKVGYTTHLLCDSERTVVAPADSFPEGHPIRSCVVSEDEAGQVVARPVYLHIWYPTKAKSGDLAVYGAAHPVHSDNPSGLDITSDVALRDVPIKKGKFPVVLSSPGYQGSSSSLYPLTEVMASHGFVTVGVDHANALWAGRTRAPYFVYGGPFPLFGIGDELMTLRIDDLKLALDRLEQGMQTAAVDFTKRVKVKKVGAMGFSYGSPTVINIAGGISELDIKQDNRINAIVGSDGGIFGRLGVRVEDVNKIKIPMMLISADEHPHTVVALQENNSKHEYMVNVQAVDHVSLTSVGVCATWQDMLQDRMSGTDTPYQQSLYSSDLYIGPLYSHCPKELLDSFSDPSYPATSTMPMNVAESEIIRLNQKYIVSFMLAHVAGKGGYKKLISPKDAEKNEPLVKVTTKEPFVEHKGNPFDLVPGSKITFEPVGDTHYRVSYSEGNGLDPDIGDDLVSFFGQNLNGNTVADFIYLDDTFTPTSLSFLGRQSVPIWWEQDDGAFMLVDEEYGDIPTFFGYIPYYTEDKYGLLNAGNGMLKVAAYHADLEPGAGYDNGVFQGQWFNNVVVAGTGLFGPGSGPDRIINTWVDVPKRFTGEGPEFQFDPNIDLATTTFQIIYHYDGKIELIYGDIDGIISEDNTVSTRAASPTGQIATVGISFGDRVSNYPNVPISDANRTEVDFTAIPPGGIVLPVGAIFEDFTERTVGDDNDDYDDDDD